MGAAFRRVALIGKLRGNGLGRSLRALRAFLVSRGCEVLVEKDTAAELGEPEGGLDYHRIGQEADLAVAVGGDGTMLTVARNLARAKVPLTGVNLGRVGFMTDIALQDMQLALGAVLEGRHAIEERVLLEAEVWRGERNLLRTVALNEAVLGKGSQGRLIEFQVLLDGEYVYTLRADGMIVATPTGSTAYALSAQGPILHPAVPAIALVPLNPHTLSVRPVSVSDRSVIEIVLVGEVDAGAYFDGNALTEMIQGDRMLLRRAEYTVRFVHPPGYRYFEMLRGKLGWSEPVRREPGAE